MEKDATCFTLKVVNNNGGLVISQGHPRVMDDTVAFESTGVRGGIMLCAGIINGDRWFWTRWWRMFIITGGTSICLKGIISIREEIVGVFEGEF